MCVEFPLVEGRAFLRWNMYRSTCIQKPASHFKGEDVFGELVKRSRLWLRTSKSMLARKKKRRSQFTYTHELKKVRHRKKENVEKGSFFGFFPSSAFFCSIKFDRSEDSFGARWGREREHPRKRKVHSQDALFPRQERKKGFVFPLLTNHFFPTLENHHPILAPFTIPSILFFLLFPRRIPCISQAYA